MLEKACPSSLPPTYVSCLSLCCDRHRRDRAEGAEGLLVWGRGQTAPVQCDGCKEVLPGEAALGRALRARGGASWSYRPLEGRRVGGPRWARGLGDLPRASAVLKEHCDLGRAEASTSFRLLSRATEDLQLRKRIMTSFRRF